MKLLKMVAANLYKVAVRLIKLMKSDRFESVLESSPERKEKLSAFEKMIEETNRSIQKKDGAE
ncbi:hypothetical protein [Desemzia sp. FAM 23990]|uniref:hypothetical protein n=1 Tax=Desemzia sp. FAM 23990 TaxID=3259520 RepID=UPI00388A3B30